MDKKMKYKIVLIDDSITECKKISQMLIAEGYNVTFFDNPFLAMEYITREVPELIISDLIMPDMDGYEVCKYLKSNARTIDIPVMLLTSMTSTEAFIKGFEAGAFDFVRKDEDRKVLTTRLKACIDYHRVLKELKSINETTEKALEKQSDLQHKIEYQSIFAQCIQSIIKNLKSSLETVSNFAVVSQHYIDILKQQSNDQTIKIIAQNNDMTLNALNNILHHINEQLHKKQDATPKKTETINLNDFLKKEFIHFKEIKFISQKIKIVWQLSHNKMNVRTMPQTLSQILSHIVANAIDATAGTSEPTLHIHTGGDTQNCWFEIIDNGNGIRSEDMTNIYQPFWTTKTISNASSQFSTGTGLGLFICKEMVESLNGRIEVSSELGVSTCFKVILPMTG